MNLLVFYHVIVALVLCGAITAMYVLIEKWTLQIDTVVALMKQNYNSATDPGQDERNEAKVTVDDVVLTTTMMT